MAALLLDFWCGNDGVSPVPAGGGEGGEEGKLLVVAVAGYARGAGAADDYVGGEGWACAVGAVEGDGGAGEFVGGGVACVG